MINNTPINYKYNYHTRAGNHFSVYNTKEWTVRETERQILYSIMVSPSVLSPDDFPCHMSSFALLLCESIHFSSNWNAVLLL
jgi:hypothetical protein